MKGCLTVEVLPFGTKMNYAAIINRIASRLFIFKLRSLYESVQKMGQEWYMSEDLEGSGRSQYQDMIQNLAGETEQNRGNSSHGCL